MKFSVIVPCWNNESYLPRCLESLCNQSYPRDAYEVILIDNNSTDESVEVARRFPRVMVLKEEIQSSYAARNHGVMMARGEIIAFNDSDCEVCATWLERLAASLTEPGTALVLGGVRNARESFALTMAADYDAQKAEYVCSERNRRLYFAYAGNMAVRREVFQQCGPFLQISRGADVVFISKVLEAYGTQSVRYVSQAQVRHLEINHVSDWLRKMSTYGRSYNGYRAWSQTRALGFRERWEVMRRTIVRNRYTWPRALSFMMLLAAGVVPFELARTLRLRPRKTGTG